MEVEAPSGAEHLQRAARDARVSDAEMERRVALKNAVVAGALRSGSLDLSSARQLLYDPDLAHALAVHRPACVVAAEIVATGCGLATLEHRVLKWSGDHDRVLEAHLDLLPLWSDIVLAPDAPLQALLDREALAPDEVPLVAAMIAIHPLKAVGLTPLLLRTLTADLTLWSPPARAEHLTQILALLDALVGTDAPSGESASPEGECLALDTRILRWHRWWEERGRDAFPDAADRFASTPIVVPPPIRLLPEDGGEYTLAPPARFSYVGRDAGTPRVATLAPRSPCGAWRARFVGAAARLLDDGELGLPEYEGTCALDGWRVHEVGRDHAITLSIPDPALPVAWLACSECGCSGYVGYSLGAVALSGIETPGASSDDAGPIA